MVKLINAVTGGEMWVHEDRLAEYLAAGYKPAEKMSNSDIVVKGFSVDAAEKPKTTRKTTKKPKE